MIPGQSAVVWPPQYKVRRHRLARRVKMRASHHDGLEITVPPSFNLHEIPRILEENKSWIIKQIALSQATVPPTLMRPDHVEFNALNELWKIHYVACQSRLEIIQRPHREIVLTGKIHETTQCRKKLIAWIRNYSRDYLISQLETLSLVTGMEYASAAVRDQKTVWGSCTSKKSISLNYKLVFLPHRLLRHIIIHELCHTKYLNHSRRFWNLVGEHDPDWRSHKLELRSADRFIPGWL
ncbi:hypothetical protein AQUSIP_23660 [Aquicella siphonis]|uniref:YgjP-like metallopeptidase domain-containing protein n=2 Tax=Aquicella siphonis TaxID=254247 RepID=A0A5E4PIZ2_9COXI|nr:hypothetical protein AQUSIP_23660 [Aquicella siphonis]